MAQSLSAAARLISRRCFSVAASLRKAEEKATVSTKGKKMSSVAQSPTTEPVRDWVPDPATGFYRPASGSVEVDAADLRRMMQSGYAGHGHAVKSR
ncbi:uncharacterized protein LOC144708602 [Wolffia australiana]